MFIVVCFKGARLQLRVKLSNPKYSSSFAALVTVGMLFSLFVVALDICALIWAFDVGEQQNVLKRSGLNSTVESHNVAVGTLVVDVMATLLSYIVFAFGLVLERKLFCSKVDIDKCLNWGFTVLLFPIFCGSKLDTLDTKQPREKMNWILAATSIAPIICFGSHIGFVVLAWLADPKHAGAVSVIYMFMFFFYYVTLKAFYQLLIDGKTSCLAVPLWGKNEVPNYCFFSCCCSCLLKFNHQHETLYELTSPLESPEKEIEAHEKYLLNSHISFWAIFMTCIFGVVLAVVQIYAIASLVQLPLLGVIEDTPNYILSLFQVAVFLLTAVITYTILTAEESVERELLKNVVRNFDYYFQKAQNHVPPPPAGVPQPPPPPPAGVPPPAIVVQPQSANRQPVTERTPVLHGRQQTSAETATHTPPRSDEVQKLGNIVGALVFKHLNEHIVIKMDGSTSEDDLL